jgi:tetratricopeptide (TPR) repeat protein
MMARPRCSLWSAVATALLVGSMSLGACLRSGGDESPAEGHQPIVAASASACECAPSQPVVDPALLAFLSKAKSVHLQADLAEEDEKVPEAVKLLEDLLADPAPGGDAPPPEVREVKADTTARLAELQSGEGQFDEAKKNIDRGLALATETTHYRGRLMEVLGVVEQRRHDALLAEGDEAGAKAAKERAIAALQQAVTIQDEVIRSVLGDAGPAEDPLK